MQLTANLPPFRKTLEKSGMKRFLQGIIVGLGGVAPGLSGSVLLIIFGMYQKTLDALGTLFGNLKKNLRFLLPLLAGMGLGVLLFSRVIDFCLANYEMPTRFCFLGLIMGTVPMVWREVRKETFRKWHYLLILLSAAAGFWMFTMNPGTFPQVTDPTVLQSAVLLTTLGFYEMYVHALATLELTVLAPMVLGLAAGAVGISFMMSQLFRRFYTATYSVIFGIFLSMIPNMLNESCVPAMDAQTALSLVLMVLGFGVSFYLGGIGNKKERKG